MAEDDQAVTPVDAPSEDALDEVTPVETPAVPLRATYHVAIWDLPDPAYVCLLCPPDAPHFTLDSLKEHIPSTHDCDAIPTETIPFLLNLRIEADARVAAEAEAAAAATQGASEAPAPVETPATPAEEQPDARPDLP